MEQAWLLLPRSRPKALVLLPPGTLHLLSPLDELPGQETGAAHSGDGRKRCDDNRMLRICRSQPLPAYVRQILDEGPGEG